MEFTRAYFIEECDRFRAMLGTKTFWELAESKRDQALKSLFLVYVNVTDPKPGDEVFFQNASESFNQRTLFLTMLPLKKALGMA